MDGVGSGYSAPTADPSTSLRYGRDDKGRGITFRKDGASDGQSQERLLRADCRSLRYATVGMTRGGRLLSGRMAPWMDGVNSGYSATTADHSTSLGYGRDDKGEG